MNTNGKYHIEDYLGKTINYLTPISLSEEKYQDSSLQWEFQCICGRIVLSPPARVISGHKKSCGCMRYKTPEQLRKKRYKRPEPRVNAASYIGKKNERLTVVGYRRPENKGRIQLECLCDCGKTTFVYPYQFDSGDIKSCGCARLGHSECHKGNTSRRTHNLTKHRFYKKWNDMIRRCYNENEPAYKFYGARGITVCEEWRYSPENFINWCESTHPAGEMLTIDRIDGAKGYSPENCRWITQTEQAHNLRNNRKISVFGETKCVTTWCRELNISAGSVYGKVKRGMSFEEAIIECAKKNGTAPVE